MKKFITTIIMTLLAVAGIFASTACSNKTKDMKAEDRKMIVCYFSATGTTAKQAKRIADMTGAALFEIQPENTYTAADLDWTNSRSRSSVEMHNKSFRPALKDSTVDLSEYDVIFIGYPNWWNTCPTIINTFIEAAHLDSKTVVPFMTSGGSNITNSEKELAKAYPDINWKKGLLMNGVSDDSIRKWLIGINE